MQNYFFSKLKVNQIKKMSCHRYTIPSYYGVLTRAQLQQKTEREQRALKRQEIKEQKEPVDAPDTSDSDDEQNTDEF